MCGIAGIHSPNALADAGLVRDMVARLVHRGPDGDGHHADGEVAIGMRRLSIIDPAHGHQPLRNETGDIVVVFNGELYNHADLRKELEARGHVMPSGSDGEIIPHLYEEHGFRFVELLNGIFAIALWDANRRELHLARDRFGVKPLYVSETAGRVAFASEVRALLADPSLSRELDYAAIDHFLTFRFVPHPRTALRDVRKVPPASVFTSGPSGTTVWRYASEPPSREGRTDTEALVQEYRATFERAVTRQLMSDVPLGLMLSGGIDSGAICAVMARHASRVRAFTVGFAGGDADSDEIAAAAATARRFGAEHEHALIGEQEYLDALPVDLAAIEEPVGTTSAPAVRFVARLMRPHVTVGLSGQGADEPLGGYGRHRGALIAQRLRGVPGARALAARLPRPNGDTVLGRGLDALAARSDIDLLLGAYRVLTDAEKATLYRAKTAAALSDAPPPAAALAQLQQRVADREPLAQMLYVDTRLWLPDELLLIADKMSMAESLELRVPMLDNDLVALAESAAPTEHVGPRGGKRLHKAALRDLVGEDIADRPKLGWQTPVDRWLRGPLRPLVDDVVLTSGGLCRELFEERALRELVDAHTTGRADHTRQLFCLLSLGLWHQGVVATPAVSAAAV
jgi:asparagine synthase (glutamine-hydrolysing)